MACLPSVGAPDCDPLDLALLESLWLTLRTLALTLAAPGNPSARSLPLSSLWCAAGQV